MAFSLQLCLEGQHPRVAFSLKTRHSNVLVLLLRPYTLDTDIRTSPILLSANPTMTPSCFSTPTNKDSRGTFRWSSSGGLSSRAFTVFYRSTNKSILSGCITAWYSNSTAADRRALQRVIRAAVGCTLQDTYNTRCCRNVKKIIRDPSHLICGLFSPRVA